MTTFADIVLAALDRDPVLHRQLRAHISPGFLANMSAVNLAPQVRSYAEVVLSHATEADWVAVTRALMNEPISGRPETVEPSHRLTLRLRLATVREVDFESPFVQVGDTTATVRISREQWQALDRPVEVIVNVYPQEVT